MNLIGNRAIVLPHKNLHDDYYNLKGVIVNYNEESEIKRNPKMGNEPMPTGVLIKEWLVEFDSVPNKEMCKKLWLFEGMFKIEDINEHVHHKEEKTGLINEIAIRSDYKC